MTTARLKSKDIFVRYANGKLFASYPMSSGWTKASALADASEEEPGVEFVAEVVTTTVYR